MKEMLKRNRLNKPGHTVGGAIKQMPANFDPTMTCEIDLKIMNKNKPIVDPNSE